MAQVPSTVDRDKINIRVMTYIPCKTRAREELICISSKGGKNMWSKLFEKKNQNWRINVVQSQNLLKLQYAKGIIMPVRVPVWRRQWHPTPVLLPGKSHGWRSLVGCSPWGRLKSDATERLHFHFSLSCIGEGNGNPLQFSCLENPRDREA